MYSSGVMSVQIVDHDTVLEALPAALDDDVDLARRPSPSSTAASGTNSAISVPSTSTRMSPGSSAARRGRLRNHLLDDEQAGLLRIRLAHARFGVARQAEPAQLGERLVDELRLQRAARHGLAPLDLRERDLDAVERQEEARGSLRVGAGVQRDDATFDVDDGRARRAARRARCGLQIEGVEVVVIAAAVVRRLAVEPRDRAGEDRELLAGVVADDADVAADLRGLRARARARSAS